MAQRGSAVAHSDHVVRPQRGRPAQGSDSPAVARVVRGAGGHLSPELDVPKLILLKETYVDGARGPRARARLLPHTQVH